MTSHVLLFLTTLSVSLLKVLLILTLLLLLKVERILTWLLMNVLLDESDKSLKSILLHFVAGSLTCVNSNASVFCTICPDLVCFGKFGANFNFSVIDVGLKGDNDLLVLFVVFLLGGHFDELFGIVVWTPI